MDCTAANTTIYIPDQSYARVTAVSEGSSRTLPAMTRRWPLREARAPVRCPWRASKILRSVQRFPPRWSRSQATGLHTTCFASILRIRLGTAPRKSTLTAQAAPSFLNKRNRSKQARTGSKSCAGFLCGELFAPQIDLDLVIPVQDARNDDDLHDELGLGAGFRSGEAQDLL